MNHDEATTRLPWYLAGTLESSEAAEVGAHLEGCAECRADLERCRLVARLHATEHPTVEELVAAAWGRLDQVLGASLARHLERCSECREEMALLSASRTSEEAMDSEVVSRSPPTTSAALAPPRRWLVAAAVVLLAASAAMIATFQHFGTEAESLQAELRSLRDRATATTEATLQAEQRIASLREELVELRAPRAGVPVVEILPDRVLRGGAVDVASVTVEVGSAPFALLLLALEDPRQAPTYTVRWLDAEGDELFISAAAAPDATGALALFVPTGSLPAGPATIEVLAVGGGATDVAGRYQLELIGSDVAQSKTTNGAQ